MTKAVGSRGGVRCNKGVGCGGACRLWTGDNVGWEEV